MLGELKPEKIDIALIAASALGHPTRFRILLFCSDKPKSFNTLQRQLKISVGTLCFHLKILIDAGLLGKTAKSYYKFYGLSSLGTYLMQLFCQNFLQLTNKEITEYLTVKETKT